MEFKGCLLENDNNLIEMITLNNMNSIINWFKQSFERVTDKEPSKEEVKCFYEYKDVVYKTKIVRTIPPKEEKEIKYTWRLC